MKRYIFLFLLSLSFHNMGFTQTPFKYWLETTSLDSLVLIKKGQEKIIQGKFKNMQFDFSLSDTSACYLKPICKNCPDSTGLSIRIWGSQENRYTDWVYLRSGETISIANCFNLKSTQTKEEKSAVSGKEKGLSFWQRIFGKKRISIHKKPALKGSEGSNPGDAKLAFEGADFSRFLQIEDFKISFKVLEKYTIQSIRIISHDENLLFYAGHSEKMEKYFPELKEMKTPEIDEILKVSPTSEESILDCELNMQQVEKHLLNKITKGQWYQLSIELADDESEHNPYLFNFQILSPEELKRFFSFFNE